MNSISRISPATSRYPPGAQSLWPDRANDFEAVESALKSGNLKAAQQALAALGQAQGSLPQATRTSGASSAFQALQTALLAGNVPAALQALATLQFECGG
jgi:hypothetical protein